MSQSRNIWVVDNDVEWQNTCKSLFSDQYSLRFFSDGAAAAEQIGKDAQPDLIIAEQEQGKACLQSQSKAIQTPKSWNIPTLVVTTEPSFDSMREYFGRNRVSFHSKREHQEVIRAAAEYLLTKPAEDDADRLLLDEFTVDNIFRRITDRSGQSVTFTSKEFQIMMAFHNVKDAYLTRDQLLETVWGQIKVGQKTLDVHLFNIRKKISTVGLKILFEAPQQYRLCQQSFPENPETAATGINPVV